MSRSTLDDTIVKALNAHGMDDIVDALYRALLKRRLSQECAFGMLTGSVASVYDVELTKTEKARKLRENADWVAR